jgi:hypothetical protein
MFLVVPTTPHDKREGIRIAYKKTLEMAAAYFEVDPTEEIAYPPIVELPDDAIEALARANATLAISLDTGLLPHEIELEPRWLASATPFFVMTIFQSLEDKKETALAEYQAVVADIKATLAAARESAKAALLELPALKEENIQSDWIERSYRFFLASHASLPVEKRTKIEKEYKRVWEEARNKSAYIKALNLLCAQTGQAEDKIKEDWITIVARPFLLTADDSDFNDAEVASAAALREAHNFFNPITEEDMPKSTEVLYSEFAARQALAEFTGQHPNDIKHEWIARIAPSFLPAGYNDESERIRNEVLVEARKFFEEGRIFPIAKMKAYLAVADIFDAPLASQNLMHVDMLPAKSAILDSLPKGIVRDIYLEFLIPYNFVARNPWLFGLYYGGRHHELLRQHFARFVQAIVYISDNYKHPAAGSSEEEIAIAKAELDLICNSLQKGMQALSNDLDKDVTIAARLAIRGKPSKSLPAHEIVRRDGIEMVLITSPTVIIRKLAASNEKLESEIARLTAEKAALAADKAALTADKAALAADKAALTADKTTLTVENKSLADELARMDKLLAGSDRRPDGRIAGLKASGGREATVRPDGARPPASSDRFFGAGGSSGMPPCMGGTGGPAHDIPTRATV